MYANTMGYRGGWWAGRSGEAVFHRAQQREVLVLKLYAATTMYICSIEILYLQAWGVVGVQTHPSVRGSCDWPRLDLIDFSRFPS